MNVVARQARRLRPRFVPADPVELVEITAPADRRPGPNGEITLGFRLAASRPQQIDALRDARCAILREERMRGLDEGEPSLAEAVFTATRVLWEMPFGEQARGREKLAGLVRRANGLLEPSPEVTAPAAN